MISRDGAEAVARRRRDGGAIDRQRGELIAARRRDREGFGAARERRGVPGGADAAAAAGGGRDRVEGADLVADGQHRAVPHAGGRGIGLDGGVLCERDCTRIDAALTCRRRAVERVVDRRAGGGAETHGRSSADIAVDIRAADRRRRRRGLREGDGVADLSAGRVVPRGGNRAQGHAIFDRDGTGVFRAAGGRDAAVGRVVDRHAVRSRQRELFAAGDARRRALGRGVAARALARKLDNGARRVDDVVPLGVAVDDVARVEIIGLEARERTGLALSVARGARDDRRLLHDLEADDVAVGVIGQIGDEHHMARGLVEDVADLETVNALVADLCRDAAERIGR